ncbi:efflux RND transporter permease subunit [Emcibacter sp. SYSU 3D8]|uniref:efflux RND transporter permease subunit n=1 Tax=Emcibacter sp. SYSU 3D8 TaxID=3133969 RepID=UPI0031FF0748
MPRFFVDRPIFAWVIAFTILLAGVLTLRSLPIEQYPSIAPPSLTISTSYPGADAATLETNVTSVIEQELNGVAGFLYMSSTSQSDGSASITVTFRSGTDIDVAQMEVQNRLSRVEPRLPEDVRQQGVQVNQANTGFLMLIALTSPSNSMSQLDLSNYASNRIIDELKRVPGVGDIRLFGSPYAMRIWLDTQKLSGYGLSAAEALAAVREQNSQTAGGQIGDQPTVPGTQLNAVVVTQNRFTNPEQFGAIILRSNPDGSSIKLRDVARVELGAQSYGNHATLNGREMGGMAVQLQTGANALATAKAVKARVAELSKDFPGDMTWSVPYDTTPFIQISVEEVAKTLAEAIVLVFLVMFLFLQNLRATLIPTVVVPVALAGACLGLSLFGFSINVLTLFAMVLAIGILVDDAIVVIENVERLMREEKLSPRDATIKAMGQITGALIGITLVLVAVFIPMAFFPGSTGGIYRQFSVTLAVSMAFSALMALTLTPALCATLLKPHKEGDRRKGFLGPFFGRFNRVFERATGRYEGVVSKMIRRPLRWLSVFAVLVGLVVLTFLNMPSSFLPEEDQGFVVGVVQAPPGATFERLDEAISQAQEIILSQPEVKTVAAIRGFSFFGNGQNAAMMFISLHPWDERTAGKNKASALAMRLMMGLQQVKGAQVFIFNPPPIPELGNSAGFSYRLQDRAGGSYEALLAARNQMLGMAMQSKVLTGVRPEGMEDAPQVKVEIDRVKARALGLQVNDINQTLSIAFGSAYANDFNYQGRVLRVVLQAEAGARMTPQDILSLQVRNDQNLMVPFSAFTTAEWTAGPPRLQRYNGYSSMNISGSPAPGYSTGEAMAEMAQLTEQLPEGFGFEWTGLSYEEQQSRGQVGALLLLSLLIVFMVLAALYESWAIPVAVMLIVPLGVLGALALTWARGLSLDIYFNVGMITIIGLAAKNAILIVEFAKDLEAEGKSTIDATLEAVRLRLRPIIMTSMAFILGVLPLAVSSGAGSASRIAVGTGVVGGMIAATAFGIFFVPVFYLSTRRWLARKKPTLPGAARETGP